MSRINLRFARSGSILIYVLFLMTVMVTAFSYVTYQTFSNLSILSSIKRTFSLYTDVLGAYEETLVAYFDDPVFRDPGDKLKGDYLWRRWGASISRYKTFVDDFVDPENTYSLNLTEFDGEFASNAKSLRYLDVFWNDFSRQPNACDLSVSFLRWSLGSVDELVNKKVPLPSTYRNLVSASYASPNQVLVRFSSGFVASPALSVASFSFSSYSGITISALSKLDETNYTLNLSSSVPTNYRECVRDCLGVSVASGAVRDTGGSYIPFQVVPIHSSPSPYANRFRLEDSGKSIVPSLKNYSTVISSSVPCFFWMEWTDGVWRVVDVPSSWVDAKIESFDGPASGVSRILESDSIKLGPSLYLSNYLYKLK